MEFYNHNRSIRVTTSRIPTIAVEFRVNGVWEDAYFAQDETAGKDIDGFSDTGFEYIAKLLHDTDYQEVSAVVYPRD